MRPSEPSGGDLAERFARLLTDLEAGREPDLTGLGRADEQTRARLKRVWEDWRRGRKVLGRSDVSPTLSEALRRHFGADVDPGISLEPEPHADPDSAWSEVLKRLASHAPEQGRYRYKGEVARGGMGAILKVWDEDLRRSLAKKILLDGDTGPKADDRSIGRFLEEAQVTAQLEHPGIVPVHELGVDSAGHVYFTMRLVRGRDLRAILGELRDGTGAWTLTRVLGVLMRVCEAMAYAHSRDVVHRDLKPANVMVGKFGEVYVMDWGLARVRGSPGHAEGDLEEPGSVAEILTDRHGDTPPGEDSPLLTREGAAIGTPAYMSPEQARGDLASLGPSSDVYAVGAILYQVLAGHMPYVGEGERSPARVVLERVLAGPPPALRAQTPDAPAELVAICERAMARDPSERYPDMRAMGDDLGAYLENRVVRAHRTGAVPELVKWVGRNRLAAAALAGWVLILAGAGFSLWAQERARSTERLRHTDEALAPALLAELAGLGPLQPDALTLAVDWEERSRELASRASGYRRSLKELRARAVSTRPFDPASDDPFAIPEEDLVHLRSARESLVARLERSQALLASGGGDERALHQAREAVRIFPGEIERFERRIAAEERRRAERRVHAFASDADQREHARLTALVAVLGELESELGQGLPRLRDEVSLVRDALEHPAWSDAIESIADVEDCPAYAGLRIRPQLGLVPLGRNRETGLWEFRHALSGTAPGREAGGALRVTPASGVVLVLLPGGRLTLGAQATDEHAPHYDPAAAITEGPPFEVELAPFFLAAHELTQAQWERGAGSDPSQYLSGMGFGERIISRTHPVESVAWADCAPLLQRWGLTLPTEAQWEHAARAGEPFRFWGGTDDFAQIADRVNHNDLYDGIRPSHDGFKLHGPVDAFPPNAFGLVGVLGNVREWCLDWHRDTCEEAAPLPGSGLNDSPIHVHKSARGGSWMTARKETRVSVRWAIPPAARVENLGLRPARPLEH